MTLQNKTITIFGGTGFVGRHLVWQLAKTGATIRIATRLKQRAYFLRPAGDVGQIIPLACNIHDDASVAELLDGATHAVNLAGIIEEKGKNTFQRVNVDAAERIARISREKSLEMLVHMSVMGASLDSPWRYAKSKAEGENKAVHAFPSTVIVRPSVVFGPEDHFFNFFASIGRMRSVLPLFGGGKTKFQPVYVGDIARAVTHILEAPEPSKYAGQIYEFGGPRVYTLAELMATLKEISRLEASIGGSIFSLFKSKMLQYDSVAQPGSLGLKDLGIEPTSVETILPTYARQYWPGGAFGEKKQAS